MRLNNITLENFRNYKKTQVSIDSDLVLILGDNASGKTNFLESIYFLSRLKSFRAPDNLLPTHQQDFFNLSGEVGDHKLEAVIQINPFLKRQFKLDGQKTSRMMWQPFSVVLFAPNDLNLFHLGPALRRKFLDEILTQTDQDYNVGLISFEHVLKQKSALLEQFLQGAGSLEQLEFWNQQLAQVGAKVAQKRARLLGFFQEKFNPIMRGLGFSGSLDICYSGFGPDLTETALLESLKNHEQAEIRSGKNLVGPHRDDFVIEKDGVLNIYNSSRGELRGQVLALKLLQAEYLTQPGKRPIILLDDVFSELDESRRIKLLENLAGHQIFITSTEEHHLPQISKDTLVLRVENNEIKGLFP
jgi:DNA replication and repair protein RecF